MAEPVVIPSLGETPATDLVVTGWYARPGAFVHAGERLLELCFGEATFDLSAPVSGVLVDRQARPFESVRAGQVVALIEVDETS